MGKGLRLADGIVLPLRLPEGLRVENRPLAANAGTTLLHLLVEALDALQVNILRLRNEFQELCHLQISLL